MRRMIPICILCVLMLASCREKGRIEVLTPLTSGEDETRRVVSEAESESDLPGRDEILDFVVNLSSRTFHLRADCAHAKRIDEANRRILRDSAQNLVNEGYRVCGSCGKALGELIPESPDSSQTVDD